VRTFQGLAASLSLLAMTAKGFAYASPVIMRTAAVGCRRLRFAGFRAKRAALADVPFV
jgi:hypothetical protein